MPLTYFRPRGDLKSNWESANPILKLREMGLEWETTVGVGRAKVKFGDGTSAWNSLDYAIDVESTIQSDTKSNWTSNNPVLQSGQIGLEWETTVGVGEINIKVGDGATAWNSLGYGFTYDITNKEIKTITEYSGSEENPKLEDGDTLSEVAGKLNKQNDFLKTTLGYERLDAMAETLGGLSNEDFMGVMEKLNSLKFNKSDVYNGTDSTSTTLAASANALKTVKDLADSNASDIAELNSDLNGRLIRGSDFTGLNAPAQSDGSYYRVQLLSSGQFRIAKNIGGSFGSWNDFLTNADLATGTQEVQFSSNSGEAHVNFGKTMPNVPVVILTPFGANPETYHCSAYNVTQAGFDLKLHVDNVASGSLRLYWVAITRNL